MTALPERAVGGVAIEMRPAVALRGDEHVARAADERNLLLVDPGRVEVRKQAPGRARPVQKQHVEARLGPIRRLDGDRAAVGLPRDADDVFVARRRRLHPGGPAAAQVDDAEADLRIRPADARVALGDDLGNGGLEAREGRDVDLRLIAPKKRDGLRIGRPPEAVVVVVKDLLPVDEGENPVQDRGGAVGREPALGAGRDVQHVEVVVSGERDRAAVGREPAVDLARRLSRVSLSKRERSRSSR